MSDSKTNNEGIYSTSLRNFQGKDVNLTMKYSTSMPNLKEKYMNLTTNNSQTFMSANALEGDLAVYSTKMTGMVCLSI